jgi:NAD(P)-dependent dehydrogenase (short-subunit alcohol dehydrogenase family)
MDYQIRGKCAFVSAGAHGIGEAIADLLTEEGARVVVADCDEAALHERVSRWAGVIAADLATAEGVDQAVSEVLRTFGRAPDILINNLGVGNAAAFEEIPDEVWARSFNVNLMGTIRTCRALLPQMAKQGSGAVVNTGSDLAKQPEPTLMDYGVCKAGLLYLTKALAKQYVPSVSTRCCRARSGRKCGHAPAAYWTSLWLRTVWTRKRRCSGSWPSVICRWALESRSMWRMQSHFWRRLYPNSSPAQVSISEAR